MASQSLTEAHLNQPRSQQAFRSVKVLVSCYLGISMLTLAAIILLRNNAAIALECARVARDLLGANGITDEYPVMRHMCNLETVKTYEGTDHIHSLAIGERVTGIAAYR